MSTKRQPPSHSAAPFLWDLFCVFSVVGIWPRFIEPNLLFTTRLTIQIPHLPVDLRKFKILQFSDLHFGKHVTDHYLKKLERKIHKHCPDLIIFSGDMLCYGKMRDEKRLKRFLKTFYAPYGCYAILGNHDYAEAISVNEAGDYDVIESTGNPVAKGLSRIVSSTGLTGKITDRAQHLPPSGELLRLLEETPFQILDNKTVQIKIKDAGLNISGLGEYMAGKADVQAAFQGYNDKFPGIIIAHNPDTMPLLEQAPGDIVLSGHTHGGQINLPWLWKKFTLLENLDLKKGLHKIGNKWIYISRGVGSVFKFRWFSTPEILLLTLEEKK